MKILLMVLVMISIPIMTVGNEVKENVQDNWWDYDYCHDGAAGEDDDDDFGRLWKIVLLLSGRN